MSCYMTAELQIKQHLPDTISPISALKKEPTKSTPPLHRLTEQYLSNLTTLQKNQKNG